MGKTHESVFYSCRKQILIVLLVFIVLFSVSYNSQFVLAENDPGHDSDYIVFSGGNMTNNLSLDVSDSGLLRFNGSSDRYLLRTLNHGLYYNGTTANFSFFGNDKQWFSTNLNSGKITFSGNVTFGNTLDLPATVLLNGSQICTASNGLCGASNANISWIAFTNNQFFGGNITTHGNVSLNMSYFDNIYVLESESDSITAYMILNDTIANADISTVANISWFKINFTYSNLSDIGTANILDTTGILNMTHGGTNLTGCSTDGYVLKWVDASSSWVCSADTVGSFSVGGGSSRGIVYFSAADKISYNTNFVFSSNDYLGLGISNPTQRVQVKDGSVYLQSSEGPTTLNSVTHINFLVDVKYLDVSDNIAYTLMDRSGFDNYISAINIYDPSAPFVISAEVLPNLNYGQMYDLKVRNSKAYVLSDNAIVVVDVSNPSAMVIEDYVTLTETPVKFEVVGNNIYLLCDAVGQGFIQIFDISNSSDPRLVSSTAFSALNHAYDIVVKDGYGYISAGSGVVVINVQNPSAPFLVNGGGGNSGGDSEIVISGQLVVFSNTTKDETYVYNVSNPNSPVNIATITGYTFSSAFFDGNYLFSVDYPNDKFGIYDLRNLSNPVSIFTTTKTINTDWFDVAYHDGYIIMVSPDKNQLATYEVYRAKSPAVTVGSTETGILEVSDTLDVARNVRVGEGLTVGSGGIESSGYFSFMNGTIRSFAHNLGIRMPNPQQEFHVNGTGLFLDTVTIAGGLVIDSGRQFFLHGSPISTSIDGSEISILDSGIDLASEIVDKLTLSKGGTNVTSLQSGGLLIGNATKSIKSINCSEDESIKMVSGVWTCSAISSGSGTTESSGVANYMAIFNNSENLTYSSTLYFDNSNLRLGIGTTNPSSTIDISNGSLRIDNPGYANNVGTYTDGVNMNNAAYLDVNGGYAYVLSATDTTMSIIDITNVTSPRQVGLFTNANIVDERSEVIVFGDYAYISTATNNAILVVNISNKSNPNIVNTVSTSGNVFGLKIKGNILFAGINGAFTSYDISDRTNPKQLDSVAAGSYHFDIQDDSAILPYGNNIYVVDIGDPNNMAILETYTNASLFSSQAYALTTHGSFAVITSADTNMISTLNITDLTHVEIIDNISIPEMYFPRYHTSSGNYIYVVGFNRTLNIVDVSDPKNIVLSGQIYDANLYRGDGMNIVGRHLYVSSYSFDSLFIYELPSLDVPGSEFGLISADDVKVIGPSVFSGQLRVGGGIFSSLAGLMGTVKLDRTIINKNGTIGVNQNIASHTLDVNGTVVIDGPVELLKNITTPSGNLSVGSGSGNIVVIIG